jgi:hypothetical protein
VPSVGAQVLAYCLINWLERASDFDAPEIVSVLCHVLALTVIHF